MGVVDRGGGGEGGCSDGSIRRLGWLMLDRSGECLSVKLRSRKLKEFFFNTYFVC